jgi:magnesium transporter
MLWVHVPSGAALERRSLSAGEPIPAESVWIDLVSPTPEEDALAERVLGVSVPTRDEMQEIEVSSRLYVENGIRYMTATLMCRSESSAPETTPVSFILADKRLVTVRYDEPRAFGLVGTKLARTCPAGITGRGVLLELLDGIIDRTADILERVSAEIDKSSHDIFEPHGRRTNRSLTYQMILKTIGRKGDLTSKVRESLVSIGRLLLYLAADADATGWPKESRAQLKSMQRDVQSLSDYASYLNSKITFLLDAIVGVVTIEQNNIIKIFSVVAVVLMPPTLVASIYGMNFQHMPELAWTYGYPATLLVMLVAAVLPYLFFKWKKWL